MTVNLAEARQAVGDALSGVTGYSVRPRPLRAAPKAGDGWVSVQRLAPSDFTRSSATLTAVHREDGTIELSTGCFRGTVDEFVAAVDKTHAQNEHGRAYRAAIELIRIRFAQVAQAVTA